MRELYNRQNRAISIWLNLMCLAVIIMIFIGGLTRLTDSGLSITEWNPVSGAMPPISDSAWELEFAKYKKSPEYLQHNLGMDITEFKPIYLLEFTHRIAGRATGLLYLLPLVFFLIKGHIRRRDMGIYSLATVLLAMQGFMGWYMVKSGLISDPHVSHYRLAAHLMLAVFLYMIIFWQRMKNSCDLMLLPAETNLSHTYFWCIVSILLILVQMMLGAFVAGLDAGLVYNSFPMMGDGFIPHEVSETSLNFLSFGEPVFVQFVHRIVAYILFITICVFCWQSINLGNSKCTRITIYIFLALILQMCLGIITLIYQVPIILALLHQLGAVLLLSCLLWACFLIKTSMDS